MRELVVTGVHSPPGEFRGCGRLASGSEGREEEAVWLCRGHLVSLNSSSKVLLPESGGENNVVFPHPKGRPLTSESQHGASLGYTRRDGQEG